jgi:CRISPR-associated endonuclease/helicase Cas3
MPVLKKRVDMSNMDFIARPGQSLEEHLSGVGVKSKNFAAKIGLAEQGELIGLLHDLGKYSQKFQNYIKSAIGEIDPDEDEYVDASGLKGKIDHSTAGAQYIWQALSNRGSKDNEIVAQVLALCVASHHSGLIDCISSDERNFSEDVFSKRMAKIQEKTYLNEVKSIASVEIIGRCIELLNAENFTAPLKKLLLCNIPEKNKACPIAGLQQVGLAVRYLFSCLIDADRIDSADAEYRKVKKYRPDGIYVPWTVLIDRLESHINKFGVTKPLDKLRKDISQHCYDAASRSKGIFTLTVPTGGGKTLASLRFALHHAQKQKLDRIIYVIPFTSIIDQNAQVVRDILESEDSSQNKIVLEHHSNLTPERQTWREKILCESWDAPVIYTTMVQLLETLFGAGTRGARRMHQLANSVLIFDEIQALPINCVHIFNNAINFLVEQCNSTAVLCTATQPHLHQVEKRNGAIRLHEKHEIMPDVQKLFDDLKRVNIVDQRKKEGWNYAEVAKLALEETLRVDSCLVIVNTKIAAKEVFKSCREHLQQNEIYHLSTDMCPAHRKKVLATVRQRLEDQQRVLCISTQLIEAGVDVDFGVVIRFIAGLDSIAQAAGRCNRNGERGMGVVHIINSLEEQLGNLLSIRIGRNIAVRVIDDYKNEPGRYNNNLIGPQALHDYYQYYFFDRQQEMDYPVSANILGHDDTLLNLLSTNNQAVAEYGKRKYSKPNIFLRQSFMAAAKAFKAIDAPTEGIIVPYGNEGLKLIADLCAVHEVEKQTDLLKKAQQFTVNVFPHVMLQLKKADAVKSIQEGVNIMFLNERYYSEQFGLSTDIVSKMQCGVIL